MDFEQVKELVNMLKFEEYELMENVMCHGDAGDKFYIILKGVVSIHIPNPAIKDRIHNWRKYNKLKKWKLSEFDPRVEISKKDQEDGYIKETADK
jgi:CRP-like cAMP-binding protein